MLDQQENTMAHQNTGSDVYKSDYSKNLAMEWDSLIGWENRAKAEGDFLPALLKRLGAHKVWDIATGSGFHASLLYKNGFSVRASDGAPNMVDAAKKNFAERGHDIECFVADWRVLSGFGGEKHDALICLGNSFSHLFSEDDRLKALAEIRRSLKDTGYLIIDNRNYDALLRGATRDPDHSNCCCSERSSVRLTLENEELVFIRCSLDGQEVTQISTYPLQQKHFKSLAAQVGFETVERFGDFESDRDDDDVEFFLYVMKADRPSALPN